MKLTIDPKLLADTVAWAARALPARPTAPVLAGLLLEAQDDQLIVSAFDYDISVRGTIPADIAEPGHTLLPGRLLAEVAKALPTTSFADIAVSDSEATITCGRSEFALRTMPVDDYPTLPAPPHPIGTIDGDTLAAAVNQVVVATTRDDTLPMLTGIRIDTDGDTITLAATDRYRIAVRDATWQPSTDQPIKVVLPGRYLHDIAKGFGHHPVTLAIGDNLAAFTTDTRHTTLRLLDSEFIDYRARTTINPPITATVDAGQLVDAVKRVGLVADRTTAIRLTFEAGQVLIRAGDDEVGRGSETVECELDGNPIDIRFQSQWLLDGLHGIDGPARIGMETPTKAALLSTDDGSFNYLIMSLRASS